MTTQDHTRYVWRELSVELHTAGTATSIPSTLHWSPRAHRFVAFSYRGARERVYTMGLL